MMKFQYQTHKLNLFYLSLWIPKSHLNCIIKKNLTFQLQQNQLSEQKTTTLQTPTIPIDHSPCRLPHPPCNKENDRNDNLEIPSDDDYYIVEYNLPCSPTMHLQTTQIVNCQGDTELQEDLEKELLMMFHPAIHNLRTPRD